MMHFPRICCFLRYNIVLETLSNVELLNRLTFSKDTIFLKFVNNSIFKNKNLKFLTFDFSIQVYNRRHHKTIINGE